MKTVKPKNIQKKESKTVEESSIMENYSSAITSIVESSYKIWHKYSKNITEVSQITKSLNEILEIVFAHFKFIDLIAVEIKRDSHSFFEDNKSEDRNFRNIFGPLSNIVKNDLYPDQVWTFYKWNKIEPLFITILGNEKSRINELKINEFVASKSLLDYCIKTFKTDIKEAVKYITKNLSVSHTMSSSDLKLAAEIAYTSTRYSRTILELSAKTSKDFNLPHYDQRNTVYIPIFIFNEAIGGVVVFSQKKIDPNIVSILRISLEYILYRIRILDSLALSSMFISEQVKWKADYMFLQRIYHDVQKPVEKMLIDLRDKFFLNETKDIIINKIYEQLEHFKFIISSSIGGSIDDLYLQAYKSSQKNNIFEIIDDAIWIYKEDCLKSNKHVVIEGDKDSFAYFPRFLIVEVIRNLFSNAIKYSKYIIHIKYSVQKNHTLIFQIENDGIKIEQYIIDSIMYGIYTSNYNKLGLKISKFIIETILHGRLMIKATKKGTLVSFRIKEIKNSENHTKD